MGGQDGSGPGTVSFSVAANDSASSRSATLTVAGRAIPLTQAGRSCALDVSPTNHSIAPYGGTGASSVSAPIDCSWAAASGAEWITITSGWAGTGSGTVTFSVAANTGAERSAAER
jgi:hypothetical protein